jgi:hypothetical protein
VHRCSFEVRAAIAVRDEWHLNFFKSLGWKLIWTKKASLAMRVL